MPDTTDNGYVLPRRMEGPQHAPFPGYVQTLEQRRRWTLCARIVSLLSGRHEPSGRPDARFVWVGTRALYSSDEPTGEGMTVKEELAHLRKTSAGPFTPWEFELWLEMAADLLGRLPTAERGKFEQLVRATTEAAQT